MNIIKHIPNTITCLNLACGCIGIVCAFNQQLHLASYLIALAAIFDFFDGFAARLLKVHSEIGKQLDSLADMVTFGLLPGVIMFHLLTISHGYNSYTSSVSDITATQFSITPYLGFLITIFSALRLAKFNIDTRQSDSFIGVPTPANTILIASFPLILQSDNFLKTYLLQTEVLLAITVIMSYLLVAELKLIALKFKDFTWANNQARYLLIGLSILLTLALGVVGIPFVILLYILLSVYNNKVNIKA